ncbi:hypothetical protein C0991_005351, partial [Blastosporella zonata]
MFLKGFCKSPFIVHTFAIAHLDFIWPPDPENDNEDMPIGALILSLQAVEHALKQYKKDGTRKPDTSRSGDFSFDNYGDTHICQQNKKGKVINKFEPRASQYIVPVKNLNCIKHWKKILQVANKIVLGLTKGQGRNEEEVHKVSDNDKAIECMAETVQADIGLQADLEAHAIASKFATGEEVEGADE